MSSDSRTGPNEPLEFKVLDYENGFLANNWVDGKTKLGSDENLETILNSFGAEGWDMIHYIPATVSTVGRIILRRRAR